MTIVRFVSIFPRYLDLLLTDTDCQVFGQPRARDPRRSGVALPDRRAVGNCFVEVICTPMKRVLWSLLRGSRISRVLDTSFRAIRHSLDWDNTLHRDLWTWITHCASNSIDLRDWGQLIVNEERKSSSHHWFPKHVFYRWTRETILVLRSDSSRFESTLSTSSAHDNLNSPSRVPETILFFFITLPNGNNCGNPCSTLWTTAASCNN